MFSWRSSQPAKLLPFLRTLVVASSLVAATSAAPQTRGVETGERVLPVEVTINHGAGGIWPIVSRDGVLFAPVEAFTSWRLQVRPDTPIIDYRGFRYQAISAIPGVQPRLDEQKATLELTVAAESFAATRLTRELTSVLPRSTVVPAVFANYDLNYSRTGGRVPTRGLGLLGEVGASGPAGVFTQTFVAPNLVASGTSQQLTRLESTFRTDFPDQGYTLRVGDGTLRTGLLGRNAYYGGLQFGTNFGLAPYINRQPVPLIAGETKTPSTVQLYVNDVLRQTSNVPAGPFTLDNLPVLSGNGEVTVRVRDILGRETLITQPFLVTADLLAPGINDWSVELGKLRRDLGTASWHYAEPFASGMLRRGLTTSSTGEARLEVARGRTAGGVAAVHAVGSDWLLRGGLMASHDDDIGPGTRWLMGVERPDYNGSLAVSLEGNSRNFRSLGEDDATLPPRVQLAAQAGWALKWGRIGIALALQRFYDAERVATYSINYSTTLFDTWQLNTYFTQGFRNASGYTVGAVIVVPFERRTTTSTSVQVQDGRTEFYTSATHTPDGPTGLAWRTLVADQIDRRVEGGLTWLSPHGLFSAETSVRSGATDVRLGAVGGLLWARDHLFALPRFDNSAALVEVQGQPHVGVGMGAQVTAHTDDSGIALVNHLIAYQKNPIRIDPNDLPISAEVPSIEVEAVPPWRSVARVDFAVRGGRAALLHIVLDDGQPAPPGATVHIEGEDHDFLVARRGEAYVTGLKLANRLQLRWGSQACNLDVQLPPGGDADIARLGPLRCTGVTR